MNNNIKNIAFIALVTVLTLCVGYPTLEAANRRSQKSEYTLSQLVMPVDEGAGTSLQVSIPKNFKLTAQNDRQENGSKYMFFEFMPKDNNPNNWKETVNFSAYINYRLTAQGYLNYLYEGFKQQLGEDKVLKPETFVEHYDGYDVGFMTFSYLDNGRFEVINVYIYAGQYDAVVAQHAYHLEKVEASQAQFEAEIKDLKRSLVNFRDMLQLINKRA